MEEEEVPSVFLFSRPDHHFAGVGMLLVGLDGSPGFQWNPQRLCWRNTPSTNRKRKKDGEGNARRTGLGWEGEWEIKGDEKVK